MKTLTHKQRILLTVVERLSEKNNSSRFMLVKTLFLLAREENMGRLIKFYNFFPYRYGPFSNVCYADLYKLEQAGLLTEDGTHLTPTEAGRKAATSADRRAAMRVKRVTNRFNSDREIREYVYRNYHEYTVKSEIVPAVEEHSPPQSLHNRLRGKRHRFIPEHPDTKPDRPADRCQKKPFQHEFQFYKKQTGELPGESGHPVHPHPRTRYRRRIKKKPRNQKRLPDVIQAI